MGHPQDFKSMQDQIQAALIATTRTSGLLAAEDLGFQRSLNPSIVTSLDEQSNRILELSRQLLKSATSISDLKAPILEDLDDVDNNWRGVVDVVDSLLEKADTCLDEYTGVIKRKDSPVPDQSLQKRPRLEKSFRTQNIVKPQLGFLTKANNHDHTPWKPLLTSKPHAIVPLEESLEIFTNELQHEEYQHPYQTEISQLQYPQILYEKAEPIPYLPVDTTTATFVDTFEGVLEMLEELKLAKEIAVDLEHHDSRSYVGLVSLMQISTRKSDWIVDTLKPWREDLQVLNEVFADPKIIKVFHGAFMDIVWLQRDLGLYITGLFDTHHACRVLGYPGGSLAYLLKRFIGFDADKQYQMADWRIRPLPQEMFYYARADTHYLLYIYDNLRNELIDRADSGHSEENSLELVLQKSQETALTRFHRQIYDEKSGLGPAGWYNILLKSPGLLSPEQFAVYRAVHAWRDSIARTDDDSPSFVMPNHVILTLAKVMPTDMKALYSSVQPISHAVKSRVTELLEVIKIAKENGVNGPSMLEVLHPESVGAIAAANFQNMKSSTLPLLPDMDETSLRAETSAFWGGAFGSSLWDKSDSIKSSGELKLAIPMPQLSTEPFAKLKSAQEPREHEVSPVLACIQEPSTVITAEEAFTIKNGKKRKIEALSAATSNFTSDSSQIALDNEQEEAKQAKRAKKAARNAAKKLKKMQKLQMKDNGDSTGAAESVEHAEDQGDEEDEEEEEELPFDYSKAESVLHGSRKEPGGKGGKRKKPFDPYAKSENAAKGIRRLQTERPGKSLTFKS